MPSPIGHGLLGVTVALGVLPGTPKLTQKQTLGILIVMGIAMLPDIDLLFGLIGGDLNKYHRTITHSVTFACLSTFIAGILLRADRRIWIALLMASMSHLLADWLGEDPPPGNQGIQLLWPFNQEWYIAPHPIFPRLHKDTLSDMFQLHNVKALVIETALCLIPFALVCGYNIRNKNQARHE